MIRTTGLAIGFLTVIGALIWGAAGALGKASERTVTYQYISDALDAVSQRPSHVTWTEPTRALTRAFTPGDAATIGQAMTEAWHALTLAQDTGEAFVLRDGFSGVAHSRAERSVQDAALGGRMVVLAQEAQPHFYHLDGSVFQAEVALTAVRYMAEGEALTYHEVVRDRSVTTLMNESNGWRVYAHERHDATPVTVTLRGWTGTPLAGINYYPAATPWREFWPQFDPQIVATDLDRAAALGATAIRVFLTADYFADPATRDAGLAHLATLLEIAEGAGLKVVPTLFDLKPSYDPTGWGQDLETLTAVLPVLTASSAVTLLDLKNEPDLDYAAVGRPKVQAWLSTMAILAREQAPDLPLTIGWSSADAALDLTHLVDVISYHDYADLEKTAARYAAVRAATDRPVMITEIGASSYTLAAGFPGSPDTQAAALTERLSALADADGVFVWTLYDFPAVDAAAVGGSPWVQRLQGGFGLLGADGTEKPAAAAARAGFERLSGR